MNWKHLHASATETALVWLWTTELTFEQQLIPTRSRKSPRARLWLTYRPPLRSWSRTVWTLVLQLSVCNFLNNPEILNMCSPFSPLVERRQVQKLRTRILRGFRQRDRDTRRRSRHCRYVAHPYPPRRLSDSHFLLFIINWDGSPWHYDISS